MFAILAERYERRLLGTACAILKCDGRARDTVWPDACDIVQETWLRVIRGADRFRADSSFQTWLYTVLINTCRTRMKQNHKRRNDVHESRGIGGLAIAGSAIPDSFMMSDEQQRDLTDAVQTLPAPQREILILCYHHGLTQSQAAEILGIPIGTLKSRLNSGLNELRTLLGAIRTEAIR